MAEQEAVNFKVVGSNPTRGAFSKLKLDTHTFGIITSWKM